MVPALTGPRATPLADDATAPGEAVVGLRLTEGSLVLKLERGGEAAQSRLEPGSGFGPADGVPPPHDLLAEPQGSVTRLQAARQLAVRELSRRGGGRAMVTC